MNMQSVTEYFEKDHDRLDSLFTEFRALKRSDARAAKRKFKEFLTGLTRHIVWEEEILFPLFEDHTGIKNAGPTLVMRQEHRMIEERLDAIHEKVRAGDPESDAEEAALLDVLGAHNQKEEHILYPAIDDGLDARALEETFARMQAVPSERFDVCCGGEGHGHG